MQNRMQRNDLKLNGVLLIKDLGEVTVNGQTGKQLQCYFGSSTYNTLEFSRLLDGTINDAKEIGINLISDADMALMLEEWGK